LSRPPRERTIIRRSGTLGAFCFAAWLCLIASRILAASLFDGPSAAEAPLFDGPSAAEAPLVAGEQAPFLIDAARSELRFTIGRPGETIDGHAHRFTGEARFDPAHPEAGATVTLDVQAGSLETGNRVRDHKMRGSHLEIERFPEILFRSTSIQVQETGKPGTGGPADVRTARKALIEGIVTLHGVPRSILFPALIRYDNGSLAAEGDFAIRLTDHAIAIPRFLWIVLDDEVKIHFRFEAAPQTAAEPRGGAPTDGSARPQR